MFGGCPITAGQLVPDSPVVASCLPLEETSGRPFPSVDHPARGRWVGRIGEAVALGTLPGLQP